MATLTAPATHPKSEPIFSTMRSENDAGQFLAVYVTYADGSRDWEEALIAPIGDFVPSEVEEEIREKLERILRRRHAARLAEAAKPAADVAAERKP